MKLTTVIPAILNRIRPGATFMSVMGYTNNFDELSNFGLVFHVSYLAAVQRSLDIWEDYRPQSGDESLARMALLRSYKDSLTGFNPRYKAANVYEPVVDGKGVPVNGTKWYKNGKEVHIWGFRVHKVILSPGQYQLTVNMGFAAAKRRLLSMAPVGNYRQFKIIEGRFKHIGVEGLTLTHRDRLRELA